MSGSATPQAVAGMFSNPEPILSRLLISKRHTLIPPRGYSIGGLSGSSAAWLDGFSLIITR